MPFYEDGNVGEGSEAMGFDLRAGNALGFETSKLADT
jgi:hypothetical protein